MMQCAETFYRFIKYVFNGNCVVKVYIVKAISNNKFLPFNENLKKKIKIYNINFN